MSNFARAVSIILAAISPALVSLLLLLLIITFLFLAVVDPFASLAAISDAGVPTEVGLRIIFSIIGLALLPVITIVVFLVGRLKIRSFMERIRQEQQEFELPEARTRRPPASAAR